MSLPKHGIARAEWESRFKVRLAERAVLTSEELPDIFTAELSSWPENEEDWTETLPEEAADDNLSYWTDDE